MTNDLLRDNLLRVVAPADLELREEGEGPPVMFGHFTPIGQWAEIHSEREGHFMERTAEGVFDESFERSTPRVLFQHGRDPSVGEQILGIPAVLRSDAYAEVPLFRGVPELIVEGLRAKAYGQSYRFNVGHDEVDWKPDKSDFNPNGIPQRTITKATVYEFGPVTFPAYADTVAGVRSITDWYRSPTFQVELEELARERPGELARRIARVLTADEDKKPAEAKPQDAPAAVRFRTREDFLQWMSQS